MQQVLRREVKYLLSLDQGYRFSNYFSQLLQADEHNIPQGYMVRSLYFDTLDDQDYFEKEAGTDNRRKMRLRCYHPRSGAVLLEMKQKQGAQQRKRSLKMQREDAAAMIRGDYGALLRYEDPFAKECYGLLHTRCYRPKVVIQYDRKAYLARENHIRITFDCNIRATSSCHDLFSEQLCLNSALDPYGLVMEVKYDGFLPSYIKDLLQVVESRQLSASKYVMGRQ